MSKAHHYAPVGCLADREMNHIKKKKKKEKEENAWIGCARNRDLGELAALGTSQTQLVTKQLSSFLITHPSVRGSIF